MALLAVNKNNITQSRVTLIEANGEQLTIFIAFD